MKFEKYVMSLEKFKNRKPVFVFQLDENGDYDNRDVYDLHHAWIASAQRDGYKLVPLQPSNEVIVAIERKVENQLEASGINQDPFRLDGETIYEAMIGFTSV